MRNYRGATKEGHRGEIETIVVQQKTASRRNRKYRCTTKEWYLGEIINIVA
jgi:hypothetical protein